VKSSRFACIACAFAVLAILQGCGESAVAKVALREATPERQAEFADAVARSCAKFDGLDGSDVKFSVATNAAGCSVTVACDKMSPAALKRVLSVAVTNLALEYPGLRFRMDDDGTWRILLSGEILIPATGGFGIGG
jgi:hypothetical protein